MKRKVLIIDDEPDQCRMISAYLQRRAYEVEYAHTLEEGIDKLNRMRPESLLLDNNLPDGLGWTYASFIRGLFPDLHITLMTGGDPASLTNPALRDYRQLVKPMHLEEVEACVRAA